MSDDDAQSYCPPTGHHVETFAVDFAFARQWGWQCFTCGVEEVGCLSFDEAEAAGEQHSRVGENV